MNTSSHFVRALLFVGAIAGFSHAHAGRPLTVDDANVNEVGEGHVEGWWTRAPNGSRSWSVAPAYAPFKHMELGAGLSREQHTGVETLNVQVKFRFTASQENGCNWGGVVGSARTTDESSKGYVNLLMTCNHSRLGSLHTNLGAMDFSSRERVGTWGVAWERPYGDFTPHIEVYGQAHEKPTWATGLRTNVLPNLQLDTSVGRQAGRSLVTVGTKWMF